MRKTPLNKNGKSSISKLKKALWKEFSLFIRRRDKYTCFTCGNTNTGSKIHAGHFISKAVGGTALYFHEDNVHAQCYFCNIYLGGNQYVYGEKLGKEMIDKLRKIKESYTKWTEKDYLEKIEHYKKLNEQEISLHI